MLLLPAHRQGHAAETIRDCGGLVWYDWQSPEFDDTGRRSPLLSKQSPPGPAWLRELVGDDYFQRVERITLIGSHATDLAVACLAAFPRLRGLYMRGARLSDIALDRIGRLEQLRSL